MDDNKIHTTMDSLSNLLGYTGPQNSEVFDIQEAWYVGATGNNDDGVYTDFSERYISEGRWENGYDKKYTEIVKNMKVGDQIVIKSSYVQKNNLPFNNYGKTVAVMCLKAIGVITANPQDGKNISVKWEKLNPNKIWYGQGVLRNTAHLVKSSDGFIKKSLLAFTFGDEKQDYSLCEDFYAVENQTTDDIDITSINEEKVGLDIFLPTRSPRSYKHHPMNCILYGAPGTGKTYISAEYALAIVEHRDIDNSQKSFQERKQLMDKYNSLVKNGQIVFTTFHQSYGYEDFIQGLRPDTNADKLTFVPVDGVFKKIADKAMLDSENDYVIIIDEINRANISKVFGELITLIEEDKRWGELNAISVTLPSGEEFAVPNNLFIVGTMNSADKSISLIDTALRRRFDFIEITPNIDLIEDSQLKMVLKKMNDNLRLELESTDLLIGHSYFLGKTINDLCDIMNRSIIPLLYEYFYDKGKKVKDQLQKALDGLPFDIVEQDAGRIKIKKKD